MNNLNYLQIYSCCKNLSKKKQCTYTKIICSCLFNSINSYTLREVYAPAIREETGKPIMYQLTPGKIVFVHSPLQELGVTDMIATCYFQNFSWRIIQQKLTELLIILKYKKCK